MNAVTPAAMCNRDRETLKEFLKSKGNQTRDGIPCQNRGERTGYWMVWGDSLEAIRRIRR